MHQPNSGAPLTDARRGRAEATYRNDLIKAPFYGILEAGWSTFALIIAIRYFEANEFAKACIAGAGPMGFLLTPVTLFIAAHLRARPSAACALVFTASAFLLIGASLAQTLLFFTLFAVTSQMAAVQQGPLLLQIFTDNYGARERGSRMTAPFILLAISGIFFSYAGGKVLDWKLSAYPLIFLAMLFSALVCAFACYRMPSMALSRDNVGNPWQNISLIWEDRLFGYLLGSWMLLGLGNLIALPVRVDYLANPEFGINANNTSIALIMIVVPSVARVFSTHLWGKCFDRVHFVTTRNLLNLCFLLSIAFFFFTTNIYLLALAMAFQGIAMGGGKIIWSLWVTKIASDQKASSYMSVHMALTGLRGTLAPFLGYWIFSHSGPGMVAWIGITLITISILLFELMRGQERLKLE